jgi:hypothetical protein
MTLALETEFLEHIIRIKDDHSCLLKSVIKLNAELLGIADKE